MKPTGRVRLNNSAKLRVALRRLVPTSPLVFTNPAHLDVKPASRTSDLCQLTRYDFLDEW